MAADSQTLDPIGPVSKLPRVRSCPESHTPVKGCHRSEEGTDLSLQTGLCWSLTSPIQRYVGLLLFKENASEIRVVDHGTLTLIDLLECLAWE